MSLSVSSVGSSYNYYGAIASGKRITSAAVDPSGSVIAGKLSEQSNGTSAAMDNIKHGTGALNIADGALGGITDYLQSIKELSIKAANGTNSKADKQAIQSQIDQYKQGIADVVKSAKYNTLGLLDGSNETLKIAASADGSTINADLGSAVLDKLGLTDYDVTGDFDMSVVDDAIATVSKQRSSIGASTNVLESAYRYSANSLENVNSSLSSIADLDIPKAVSEMKKKELLNTFSLMMQKKDEEQKMNSVNNLFM